MNYQIIKQSLDKIKKSRPKALILGDLMLDHYIHGEVNRISPEAPVPVLSYEKEEYSLGGAGNVAHNSINLGANVYIASILGEDLPGSMIKELLIKKNISVKFISTASNINTTKKTRYLSSGSQLLRLDSDSKGFTEEIYKKFEKKIIKGIGDFDYIIISDYDKGVCSELVIKNIIREAIEKKVNIYIDPKGRDWGKYSNATCITPNIKEVEDHLKINLNCNSKFEKAAKILKDKYNLKSCLITRGAEGMTLYLNKNFYHQVVGKKEVFDVSGAGDTVIASLAAAFSVGISIEESLILASVTSSEVVAYLGTVPFEKNMLYIND